MAYRDKLCDSPADLIAPVPETGGGGQESEPGYPGRTGGTGIGQTVRDTAMPSSGGVSIDSPAKDIKG